MVYIVEPRDAFVAIAGDSRCLNVALINNMPDAALVQTERQFAALLTAAGGAADVRLQYHSLPGLTRGPEAREHIQRHYLPLERLWESPVDALIVTGCEPRAARLSDEPYWAELTGVLEWGCRHTSSVIASCLAAHAALLAFDGVERRRLASKRSGVFTQDVAIGHALGAGLPDQVGMPHSRLNDVPGAAVAASGYELVLSAAETGWTVAAKPVGSCLLVLMQGHPEYQRETLLLEFRRDVRRYLNRERDDYPELPEGYLHPDVAAAFERFRSQAESADRDLALFDRFPFDRALAALLWLWRAPSVLLYANWLAEIARKSSAAQVAHAR